MVLPTTSARRSRKMNLSNSASAERMEMEVDTDTPPQTPGSNSPDIPLPNSFENCTNCFNAGLMLDAMSVRIQDLEGSLVNYQNKMDLILWWITQKFGDDANLGQILNIMMNNQVPTNIIPENRGRAPDSTQFVPDDPADYVEVEYSGNDSVSCIINQVAVGNFDYAYAFEQDYAPSFELNETGVKFFQDPNTLVEENENSNFTDLEFKTEPQFPGSSSILSSASKKISPKPKTACRLCKQKFANEFLLNQHNMSHLTVSLLKLPEPISSISGFGSIDCQSDVIQNFHQKTKSEQLKLLKSKENRHIKFGTGTSSGNFRCNTCSCTFANLKSLESHAENVKCWIKSKTIQCEFCYKWLKSAISLKLHLKRKHTENVRVDLSNSRI